MKHLKRIVTFTGSGRNYYNAWDKKEPPRVRLWAVRKIACDDTMTPLYTCLLPHEKPCRTLARLIELKDISPALLDAPILDVDHGLQIYNDDEARACREGL